MSVAPDGSARLRRCLRAGQAALGVGLSRLREANERDVHQCRVDCRRLRALLKTFRPFFAEEQALSLRDALARVADLLAEIRELDVLAALPSLRRGSLDRELAAARQQAVARLLRRLASPPNRAAVESSAGGSCRGDLGLHTGITDADVLRRVRRSWRRAVARLEPRPRTKLELHQLRIRLKNCRYVLETVADIAPRDAASLRRRLRDAQQVLGDMRDAEAAADWLRSDTARATRGRVALASLERSLRKLGRDLDPALERLARAGKRWEHAITPLVTLDPADPF